MPEPEFFLIFVVAGVIAGGCAFLAVVLFGLGWWRRSTPLKVIAIVPLGLAVLIFGPMLLLLLAWIAFAIFGDSSHPLPEPTPVQSVP